MGRSKDEYLLTLTSRGPLLARRHIVVVHDLFVLTHPEWFSRSYVLTHAWVLRLQIRSARAILAVSEPVRDQVRALTGNSKPVVVVANAPANAFLESVSEAQVAAVLEKYGLDREKFVLSVGSRDPRKNLERLGNAYLSLPLNIRDEYPLVLVGPRSSVFVDVSIARDPSIKSVGYVSDADLACLYIASKIVVFPTLDEGFGLPAVEALSCGARLLVSDIPVLKWVCREHAAYVNPGDTSSIAAGLLRELSQTSPRTLDRERAREYVRSRFSWKTSVDSLLTGVAVRNRFSNESGAKDRG